EFTTRAEPGDVLCHYADQGMSRRFPRRRCFRRRGGESIHSDTPWIGQDDEQSIRWYDSMSALSRLKAFYFCHDVFISYRRDDGAAYAEALRAALLDRKFTV